VPTVADLERHRHWHAQPATGGTRAAGRLALAGHAPIAEGKRRLVFAHPDDPGRLVKVMRPELAARAAEERVRNPRKYWMRAGIYAYFTCELAEYVAVRSMAGTADDLPISGVYGVVETDLGLGLEAERLTDRAGALAPTLEALHADGAVDAALRAHLDAFFRRLIDLRVVLYELNLDNVIWVDDGRSQPRFVCIDGLGSRTFLPLKEVWRFASTRKIQQCRKRIEDRLGAGQPDAAPRERPPAR
jgi:hypothetical protein